MKTQMRKAQGGLPFGASLIIAIVLSLIGAAFIFNMGGQIFGVVKSVPTEGYEIVAIARDGGVCIQRPSSELYVDFIVDYELDALTFTTGGLQFPPDYFKGTWFQGICELSNTEDHCESDEWGIITGGGSLPSVSGQPCEWKEFDGSFIVGGIGIGSETGLALAPDPKGDMMPNLNPARGFDSLNNMGDDPDRRYREIEIGDIDGDGENEVILLKNLKYPTRIHQCPEDDPDSYYFNKLLDYKGVAVVVFGMNDYIKASKESAFPIETIDGIDRARYGEWRIYELESEFNDCDLEGEGNEAWGMSKNVIEVLDFDEDGKDEILLFAEQKIFVIEEDANGDLTHYVIDQDAQYQHSGGISKHDFFLLGNINIGKDYEALYIFRNPDITQTDVKIGVTQLIFNEEDGTYESIKTKDMDTWNIPENSWYEDATICDLDHDGWDDELVLIRGEKRSPYIGASGMQPSDFRLQIYEFEQNSNGEIWINSEPLHTTNKLPYGGRWEEIVCDDFDGDGWDEVVLAPLGISTEQDVEGIIYVLETENIVNLGDDVYTYGIEEIRNKLPWGILEIGDRDWISIAGGNLIGN